MLNRAHAPSLLRCMPCRLTGWVFGIVLGVLWSVIAGAAVQPPQITATLRESEVWLNGEVELGLTIVVEGDLATFSAENVDVPAIAGLTKDDSRTFTSQQLVENPDGTSKVTYTVRTYYQADAAGTFELGPIELRYLDEGKEGIARIEGPTLLVKDPAAPPPTSTPDTEQPDTAAEDTTANPGVAASGEEEGLRDIKGLEPAPLDFGLVFTIAGALLLLLLALAIFLIMRNRKRATEPEAPVYVAPVGLLQKTLAALDAIPEPASLEDVQAVADYYLAITNLAKEYLVDRYGIKATERTSWELRQEYKTLVASRRSSGEDVYVEAYKALFELCDGGKYAHLHATRALMAEAKVRGRTFFETDHRIPGGGTVPIGLQRDPSVSEVAKLLDDPAMDGAASGMRIRQVNDRGQFPGTKSEKPRGVPRATQLADAAVASPSTSSTLFTAADSVALVNRLAETPPETPPVTQARPPVPPAA